MCKNCKTEVDEMDIRDSDLGMLPFTIKRAKCIIPSCNRGVIVRDYGLGDYFYWPVKIRYVFQDDGTHRWRGGWFNVLNHYHTCFKHQDEHHQYRDEGRLEEFYEKYDVPPYSFTKKSRCSALTKR